VLLAGSYGLLHHASHIIHSNRPGATTPTIISTPSATSAGSPTPTPIGSPTPTLTATASPTPTGGGQLKLRSSRQTSRRGVGLIVRRRSRHEIKRRRCPFYFSRDAPQALRRASARIQAARPVHNRSYSAAWVCASIACSARAGARNSHRTSRSIPSPLTISVARRPIVSPSTPPTNDPMCRESRPQASITPLWIGSSFYRHADCCAKALYRLECM
jgi:hypothetical protein